LKLGDLDLEKEIIKMELSRILIKIGALKFGTFKLTSGKWSPYYLDLRIIPSFPDVYTKICDFYIKTIKNEIGISNIDRIAGIPTAGISFGSIVAYKLKKSFIYVRTTERQHGRGKLIEGILLPEDNVLLIDDLVTKGGSIQKATTAIRSKGGVVNHAIVLIDREENGKQNLAKDGIKLHYLLKTSELAQNLYDIEAITKEQLTQILKQIEKP
jgi:orotate phosphoribosyltransferase